VVVDLRYDQLCLIAGALDGRGLIGSPLAPQAGPDQRRERNDGGNHQPRSCDRMLRSSIGSPRIKAALVPHADAPASSRKLIYNWRL